MSNTHEGLPPVEVVSLLSDLQLAFMELICALSSDEWHAPTVCGDWSVKDLVLHMLGSQVGMISGWRDGYRNPYFADGLDITTWDELLAAIDRQNAKWVVATYRVSPQLTIELCRMIGDVFVTTMGNVNPTQMSGPVNWAGPDPVPAWMQIAREYTEYWVHQQHIRDAVGRPGLTDRRMYFPVLDTFAPALPYTLRNTVAIDGTVVQLAITGEAGGVWSARRSNEGWELVVDYLNPAATVTLDQHLAWRLFTKGVRPEDAIDQITLHGDRDLARPIPEMVTVLA